MMLHSSLLSMKWRRSCIYVSVLVLVSCITFTEASTKSSATALVPQATTSVAAVPQATSVTAPPGAIVTAPSVVETTSVESTDGGGDNIIVQGIGFIKNSVVRTIDGVGTMWRNHGTCNEIRSKQKLYKQELRIAWENQGLPKTEINNRLRKVNGGITYNEYAFLQKGKQDRSKLTQLLLVSWAAPRFLPYAIMFFPEMLPSAFAPDPMAGAENQWHALSRKRSHAVLETLMRLENDAHVVPALSKMNIFGRKAQQRAMETADRVGHAAASFFSGTENQGPQSVMDTLHNIIFPPEQPTVKEVNLVGIVPKTVVKGLGQALEASPLDNFLPAFFARKKVLAHIRKVTECDEFLVDQNVDIESLHGLQLWEACQDRLIGGMGMGVSDEQLRQDLQTWLDCAVTQPRASSNNYNGNLARTALLCYNAMDATRDPKSTSYLPRCLYQADFPQKVDEQAKEEEITVTKQSKRKWRL